MSQGVVDALGGASAAVAFAAGAMLPGRKERGVDRVAVAVDESLSPRIGHPLPQFLQRVETAVAQSERQNLSRVARGGDPKPQVTPSADTHFVDLDGISARILVRGPQRRQLPGFF